MRFRLSMVVLSCGLAHPSQGQFSAATSSSAWVPRRVAASPSRLGDDRGGPSLTIVYGYSDGSSENAVGLTNGGDIAWFQGFDTNNPVVPSDTIGRISAVNGWRGDTNGAPIGNSGGAFVYDDPGGDLTDPTDLTGSDLMSSAVWTTCCPNGGPLRSDAAGGTDMPEPIDVPPGIVSDGFWAVAMLTHAAGEFPAAFDTSTQSSSRSWVTGSNTAFDPTNPGGGVGFFEMAALGFDSVWVMTGTGAEVESYCTAKTGLTCGVPAMSFSGIPSASATSGFFVFAAPARNSKAGLILYSCSGRALIPFMGGFLCVNPASGFGRASGMDSGGVGPCDGVFSMDWNCFASGSVCLPVSGTPEPCLQIPGQQVNIQVIGRDSPGTGSFLTDALEFFM